MTTAFQAQSQTQYPHPVVLRTPDEIFARAVRTLARPYKENDADRGEGSTHAQRTAARHGLIEIYHLMSEEDQKTIREAMKTAFVLQDVAGSVYKRVSRTCLDFTSWVPAGSLNLSRKTNTASADRARATAKREARRQRDQAFRTISRGASGQGGGKQQKKGKKG